MKQFYIIIFYFILSLCISNAQTPISGIINTYVEVTAIPTTNSATVVSTAGLNVNDIVMIVQMKGAGIKLTNDMSYGDVVSYNKAGNYEFLIITSISALQISFSCHMTKTYDIAGHVQLVKVPRYNNARVNSELTCKPWDVNQRTGGVLAFIVDGDLTLNSNINVSEKGFKGGILSFNNPIHCASEGVQFQRYYYGNSPDSAGMKGEGIFLENLNYYRGRGKNANGGGGGNVLNAGGGGGGNHGKGGGGGKESDWCSSGALSVGGVGGEAITYSNNQNKIFMGGGGGCGTQELTTDGLPGGIGGGIVVIIANNIIGNGKSITANGQTVTGTTINESAGGGGAGGSILLGVNLYTGTLNIEAKGGNGGNTSGNCRGSGGGGGGGIIWSTVNSIPNNVTISTDKGLKGIVLGSCGDLGANDGQNGGKIGKLVLPISCINFPSILNNVISSNQSYCATSTVSSFTPTPLIGTTPTGGSGAFIYGWEISFDGSTWVDAPIPNDLKDYTPQATNVSTYYRRIVLSLGQLSISNYILVKVIPDITNNQILSSQIVCDGLNPLPFSVSNPNGGEGNYLYEWYRDIGSGWALVANTQNYSVGLLTQTSKYLRIVRDGGCIDTSNIIVLTKNPPINISFTKQNVSCFGLNNGSAIATASGGQGPYSYIWENAITGPSISNLSPDIYFVTVIDNVNCVDTFAVNISEPTKIVINGNYENISCFGFDNGRITINTVSGGTPFTGVNQYHYHWSNGQNTSVISGLSQGNYYVTVTDSLNCSIADTFTITEPPVFQISPQVNNISCFGFSDGRININVSGGTPFTGANQYIYNWSNGLHTKLISGLSQGNYYVTVTDRLNCSIVDTFTITEPLAIKIAQSQVTNISCFGFSNGSINVLVNGGTPFTGVNQYHYHWSNEQDTSIISGLLQGNYYVTVTDSLGCLIVDTFTIIEPLKIEGSITVDSISCHGMNDGKINVNVIGGTGNISYEWSNNIQSANNVNLSFGNYILTVTDANNCRLDTSIVLTQPDSLLLDSIAIKHVTCFGELNGSIEIFAIGGTPSYTYNWSNGVLNQLNNNLSAGLYNYTITDANGCLYSNFMIITQPLEIIGNISGSKSICKGETTDLLFSLAGNPPWKIVYSDGDNQFTVNNIISANYLIPVQPSNNKNYFIVSLSDATQCFASSNKLTGLASIIVYDIPIANAGVDSVVCGDTYKLDANSNGVGYWQQSSDAQFEANTDPQSNVTVLGEKIYPFVWVEQNGVCYDLDTVEITFHKNPTLVFAGDDQILNTIFQTNLAATPPDVGIGEWSVIQGDGSFDDVNSPNALVSGLKFGNNIYKWTVTNQSCPSKYDNVVVRVDGLKIPSGFSPNADGYNDFFVIDGLKDGQKCELTVFNRWGSEVFKSNNYVGEWNGKNQSGEDLPEDTYFFIILIDSEKSSGYVVIKR